MTDLPLEQPWLTRGKPSSFADGADVVLVLTDDDNREVTPHSAILAAQSQVLSNMFYSSDCKAIGHDHSHDGETGKKMWRVPLPNTTLKQATGFLNFIYFPEEMDLDRGAFCGMIKLLHFLGCTAALEKMDAYLSSKAGKPACKTRLWLILACEGALRSFT